MVYLQKGATDLENTEDMGWFSKNIFVVSPTVEIWELKIAPSTQCIMGKLTKYSSAQCNVIVELYILELVQGSKMSVGVGLNVRKLVFEEILGFLCQK